MSEPTTPLMMQYHAIKARYPHALLLFRLGDFYELFYEDAIIAARELQITLTSRNREKGQPIPMCGVPYHAAEGYIARLIRAGFKIAICDQMEQPGPGKKLVRREVIRVITPGTATDVALLDARENNFLASIAKHASGSPIGLAFVDLSTGEFQATEFSGARAEDELRDELQLLRPRETLLPGRQNFSKRRRLRYWKALAAWNRVSKIGSSSGTMPSASCGNNLALLNSRASASTITRKRWLPPGLSFTICAKTPRAATVPRPQMKAWMLPASRLCGIPTASATTSSTMPWCSIPFPSAIWNCSLPFSRKKSGVRVALLLLLPRWTLP